MQFEIDDERMAMAIDAWAMAEKQAADTLIATLTKDDDGEEWHVIYDMLAEPGQRLLYKQRVEVRDASLVEAQKQLEWIKRRRVVLAIAAALAVGGA